LWWWWWYVASERQTYAHLTASLPGQRGLAGTGSSGGIGRSER